jgi:hypothetical protein
MLYRGNKFSSEDALSYPYLQSGISRYHYDHLLDDQAQKESKPRYVKISLSPEKLDIQYNTALNFSAKDVSQLTPHRRKNKMEKILPNFVTNFHKKTNTV